MEKDLEEQLRISQLKFMYWEYKTDWFTVASLRRRITGERIQETTFGNAPTSSASFARYIDNLAEGGWLERGRGRNMYKITKKTLEALGGVDEDEFGVNLEKALLFLIHTYGEGNFSVASLIGKLRYKFSHPFKPIYDSKKDKVTLGKYIQSLVDYKYLEKKPGKQYALTNEAYTYATKKNKPSTIEVLEQDDEDLTQMLMEALYKEFGMKNATLTKFANVIDRVLKTPGFADSWKRNTRSEAKRSAVARWLMEKGYILDKGRRLGTRYYAINEEKWTPTEEQQKGHIRKKYGVKTRRKK